MENIQYNHTLTQNHSHRMLEWPLHSAYLIPIVSRRVSEKFPTVAYRQCPHLQFERQTAAPSRQTNWDMAASTASGPCQTMWNYSDSSMHESIMLWCVRLTVMPRLGLSDTPQALYLRRKAISQQRNWVDMQEDMACLAFDSTVHLHANKALVDSVKSNAFLPRPLTASRDIPLLLLDIVIKTKLPLERWPWQVRITLLSSFFIDFN